MPQSLSSENASPRLGLILTGVLMLLAYLFICWLSFDCEQSDSQESRPLLQVLGLFTLAGVAYLFVCWRVVWRNVAQRPDKTSFDGIKIIVGFGILFRLALLFSVPIQEVDLYRYIWDGVVFSQGISPYEYSPLEVEQFPNQGVPNYRTKVIEREDLTKLSALALSPGIKKTFDGVHFEQYTTPYPLTNQVPFAIAAVIGKSTGSNWGLLFAMKGVLVLFDLATAFLLIALLKRLSLPPDWVVAYLWCPLLLKEIANSGHLDSIAVFFNVAAVYAMIATYWQLSPSADAIEVEGDAAGGRTSSILGSCLVAVLLALAVGAKLFPVILAPIWALLMFKRIKFSAVVPLFVFGAVCSLLLWPMIGKTQYVQHAMGNVYSLVAAVKGNDEDEKCSLVSEPLAGIEAFVSRWEMNDFVFMIIIENLKPYGKSAQEYKAQHASTESKVWFVKTSNQWRHRVADWYSATTGGAKASAAFSITRFLTLIVFSLIVVWTCFRMWRNDHSLVFLEMVFLTIAWFWLLAPTQNPWYWTWALPWLVFSRNRIWYVVAIVAMAYYLRFYFEYHSGLAQGEPGLMGTPYAGTAFFDFIFPVIEFAPILMALLIGSIVRLWRAPLGQRAAP